MSKKVNETKNATTMRCAEVATKVNAVLKATELNKLYTIAYNETVDKSNRVAIFNESLDNAKQIVSAMKLQSDFMSAVSRITVWLDETQIVVFVGAVFTVHAQLGGKRNTDKFTALQKAFTESLDKKYNERKLKNKTITTLTETRHTFDSIEKYTEFIQLLSECIALRAEQKAEQSVEQSVEQKAEQKAQKAEQKVQKAKQSKRKTQQKAEQKAQ